MTGSIIQHISTWRQKGRNGR